MKKEGAHYRWPKQREKSWEERSSIILVVNPPDMINRREQYKFNPLDIEKIRKTFEGKKSAPVFA